jgi:DNA-binding transcriptional MerR regulator
MYTIGRLARKFHLSRSTLLYYDSIGLLRPSSRSEAGYRQYSERDAKRLEQICRYRQAGLRLNDIARVLDSPENTLTHALEKRLEELNEEISRLKDQQRFILGILRSEGYPGDIEVMDRESWVSLLRRSGFTEEDMLRWHAEFERVSPEKHQKFLQLLGFPEDQLQLIRTWAKRTRSLG